MIDYEWLVLQGMEGYFLDPGFDQNSMQDMLTGFVIPQNLESRYFTASTFSRIRNFNPHKGSSP